MLTNIPILGIPKFIKSKLLLKNYSNSISNVFQSGKIGDTIKIKGWVQSLRKHKEHIFLDLNDGSSQKKLQVVLSTNICKDSLTTGTSVNVSGIINASPTGQIEVHASNLEIYGPCVISDGYPFAPRKDYSPDYIRKYLHFRPRTQKFSSLLRIRSATVNAIHNFFTQEKYVNIHTPILTSNDCEGAGEIFKVLPDCATLLKSMAKDGVPIEQSFFDNKAFLSVSGQLHLEAAVHGLSKVYSFGPTFRAENSKSRLHLSEFYMLETEIAFIDRIEHLLDNVEKLIKSVTNTILETLEDDVKICQTNNLNVSWLNKAFEIITFDDANQIVTKNLDKFTGRPNSNGGFSKEQELFLVNHFGNVPVFVINWPKKFKPFYMKESKSDNTKVLAFDLLVPNVGELVGGSLRENNIDKLRNSIPDEIINLDWYLELRKFGSVPTGGYGLGFERYLMFLLGIENIKDVIPFPRWPHNCSL